MHSMVFGFNAPQIRGMIKHYRQLLVKLQPPLFVPNKKLFDMRERINQSTHQLSWRQEYNMLKECGASKEYIHYCKKIHDYKIKISRLEHYHDILSL